MTESIEIKPYSGYLHASIRPPGSKSITNRALVCAALAQGETILTGALVSDDTQVMIEALRELDVTVFAQDDGTTLIIEGCAGKIDSHGAELYVAGSGTTIRFLTAMVTLGHGTFELTGNDRMHQRPISPLLDALNQLGADTSSDSPGGCPPVCVEAQGLPGGEATVAGDISSQYLSGLLLASPYAKNPVTLRVDGPLVSKPYVQMTLEVMKAFGVEVDCKDETRFAIPNEPGYTGRNYSIEPDASAASYFWAAAAITGGEVTVQGLARDSLQGDVAFCECLEQLGCEVRYASDSITVIGRPLQGRTLDMNAISDTVQTLAAVALFAEGPTTVTGVAHNRHKESDRIGDLACELRKLGATVVEHEDGLTIVPGELHGAEITTYDDHRMAMSLALVGLRVPGITILDPGCTAKTYPRFFEDLSTLCS